MTAGEVVSSATELLLIEQKNTDGSLSLGMANPNLRPKMLDKKNWKEIPTPAFIELKGIWQMDGNVPGVFLKQWRMEYGSVLFVAKRTSCVYETGEQNKANTEI